MYLDFKTTIQNSENTTFINDNQIKKLNDFKSNTDIVYLKHFEDMDNVYVIKNVQLFNDTMLNLIGENCKFINLWMMKMCVFDIMEKCKVMFFSR